MTDWRNEKFSRIYVEEKIKDHPRTREILKKFPGSRVVEIGHYKDIFCRPRQDVALQHRCQALILAAREEECLFPGAPVCQSFGNPNFYYCSCVMNCVFDCDYCYLKGMYPSGNLVIFVNPEDIFSRVEEALKKGSAYVCASYDTDLMALEDLTGYVDLWSRFTADHPGLVTEIRTKSGRMDLWETLSPCDRVIFAFTLSPEEICRTCEHGTGSLASRLQSVRTALERGFRVRLCFDPMICLPGWRDSYEKMAEQIATTPGLEGITDLSVGSFRISADYMKKMRRCYPRSPVAQYPYENVRGVCQYPAALRDGMEEFLTEKLKSLFPGKKIFRWEEESRREGEKG